MDRSFLETEINTRRNFRYSESKSQINDPLIKQKINQLSRQQLRDLCEPVFPPQQPNTVFNCLNLKTWNSISPKDQILDPLQHEQIHLQTPFPLDYKINCKLALWVGDITNLGNYNFNF